jgi:hypothetical protein
VYIRTHLYLEVALKHLPNASNSNSETRSRMKEGSTAARLDGNGIPGGRVTVWFAQKRIFSVNKECFDMGEDRAGLSKRNKIVTSRDKY